MAKYGVANYEGTAQLKVKAPALRPQALMPPEDQDEPLLQLM